MKNSKVMEEKKELIGACKEFVNSNDRRNSYLCRFHRLYLDGSYTGYDTYKYHINRVKSLKTNNSLEKFAFQTFCKFIRIEFFENSTRITNEIIKTFLAEGLSEKYDILIKEVVQNVADFKEEHE
ncbi:hypothetical protein [Clostridium sp.]|uniref:hypothetical protein n=1 Tax=Clostridium sp. TaxID=1506 RepID=UPI0025C07FFA|nr:hypothetical protein [Clostridium sp.]